MGNSAGEQDADGTVRFSNAVGDFFSRQTFDKAQPKDFPLFVAEFSDRLLKVEFFLIAGKCLAG